MNKLRSQQHRYLGESTMLGKVVTAIREKLFGHDEDAHTTEAYLESGHLVIAHALDYGWHMSVYTVEGERNGMRLLNRVFHDDFDSRLTMSDLMNIARIQVEKAQ